jgi:hypothetical protein
MNSLRKCYPDLQACELEGRVLPVITNLGVIVLTSGGYALMIPYPGGSPAGTAVPTSFSVTDSGGISSTETGTITSIQSLAATGTAGSSGDAGVTFTGDSAANDAIAASIPQVTRNTIANDALNPPVTIGILSGDRSPVLPEGQVYRGGVPETAPDPPLTATPGQQPSRFAIRSPADSSLVRPGGPAPGLQSDVSGHVTKARADRLP